MRADHAPHATPVRIAVAVALVLLLLPLGSLRAEALPTDGQPKIIGGTQSGPGAWPSQVGLLRADEPDNYQAQFCGGTLVDREWVLTAAHCMFDDDRRISPSSVQVLIGTQSLARGGTRVAVAEIRVIPGWDPDRFYRDVAMLRLATPSSNPVQVITGQGAQVPVGAEVVATGWGTMTDGGNDFPTELMQVSMRQQSDATCAAAYGSAYYANAMSCSGTTGKDTCQGDSGGPLVTKRNGVWVQVGITSWGEGCGEPGFPGISTRLPNFATWVRQQIRLYPFADAVALVNAAHKDLFNRKPTNVELVNGVVAIDKGTSGPAYLAGLISGATYQARMGGLTRSYRAYFLRDPDQSGLDFWFAKVNAGWSTTRISDFFAQSSEFQNRYGSLNNDQFVQLIYRNVLGRDGDQGGIDFWTTQLDAGKKTRGQVMVGYSESNEYKTATRNRVNTIITTYAMLRRPPTTAELGAGDTRSVATQVQAIFESDAYDARY
ncbi:MAG: trypsin-like serine protease [Actinobacteria bacterium]|nr:trypsin-like serine protease [Actinomycetota bacterium]